ncbi:MFS transporter [Paenibacillus thiaminolyticus]|uniref:MFS transporter n=1 Tax=Paenibacillus thiaminolyticus TaxID=49283 RepID=UPI00232F7986|nr:MFS transporter [Paenibacillus thiaminolyticus]WCF08326.1 MFS transporter [Paenibacillus thiaminolyticus]
MRFFHHATTEIRSWNRNIQLFFIANLLYQIGTGMFSVLYNLYIQSLGYNDQMNGTIISIQSLATAILFIPIGLLGDRSSRKRILIAGSLVTGISFMLRAFAEAPLSLQVLAVFTGIFAAFFQVIAIPFLAENTPKEQRLKLFSYHSSMVLAAQVLGSLGGGYLADVLQSFGWNKIISLQSVLLIGGAASFAAFLPLLLVKESKRAAQKPEPAPAPSPVLASEPAAPAAAKQQEWKVIRRLTFCQLLVGLGSGLVVPYLNLYFTNRFSVSLTAVGLLISLGQVMTIVSMLIGPTLVNRVGQVRAVVLFQLMSLPFLLLTGFTNLLLIASISFLFRQALMNAANPIQSAIMVDRISDSRRGIANSLTQTAFMLGWASMGSVQSYLVTSYGYYWGYAMTFSITGVLYVTSAICYFFMFREDRPNRTGRFCRRPRTGRAPAL